MSLQIDIVTIFPNFFTSIFEHGVVGRALKSGIVSARPVDLRGFATDRHRTVDDRPFGGGEGMVLKPEPIAAALESLGVGSKTDRHTPRISVVLLSARGQRFTQQTARRLSTQERLVLLCGRYEGVDERVSEQFCDEELSIGDYVLSGGELGAAVIIDTVVRLLPGVLGNAESTQNESFGDGCAKVGPHDATGAPLATHAPGGLLDYPHYTRPAVFRGEAVPEVLLNGDHNAIRRWRRQEALRRTWQNRPDLLEPATLSREDRQFLDRLGSPCQDVDHTKM